MAPWNTRRLIILCGISIAFLIAIVSMMKQDKLTVPGLIDPLVSIEDFPETFELIKHRSERGRQIWRPLLNDTAY